MPRRITLTFAWHVVATAIILFLFLCAGITLAGYKLYKKIVLTETTQKEILDQQNKDRLAQEKKSQELLEAQQGALAQAQLELIKTKTDSAKTNAQLKTLSQTLKDQPKEIIISSTDLAPYMTGIVQVICVTSSGISSGSGSLWTFKEIPYAVVTNYHVVKDATKCVISITNTSNATNGIFSLKGDILTFNQKTDEAILTIGSPLSSNSVPIANYNYSLAQVRKCASLIPVGSPVVIVGFPAYAKRDSTLSIDTVGTVNVIYRTATNGIISGYDTSQTGEPNYFVSAKIDNGNSGGIALAKDANGICTLGLPTWLTIGNYETQGLVQNIINVLPTR